MTGDEATGAVVDALNSLAIPYMIVGSLSSNQYGIARATHDADFVVDLNERSILELKKLLPREIHIDPQLSFETVTLSKRYIATVEGTIFKIEFFLLAEDEFAQERFRRRRIYETEGRQAWFATAEDVIIQKLHWCSLANRSKDRDDVRDVISVQDYNNRLDWDHIHKWCDVHGTRALLEEIRATIPPID